MIATNILGKLRSGEEVVDRKDSHLLSCHSEASAFLPEALAQINSMGKNFLAEEVDFGRPIGESHCILTGPEDEVIYAQRPKRWGLTRFVLNGTPSPCQHLVVVLKKAEDCNNTFILITAFIGRQAPAEPWDKRNFSFQADPTEAEKISREFWGSHALIWGTQDFIPGTETLDCPW